MESNEKGEIVDEKNLETSTETPESPTETPVEGKTKEPKEIKFTTTKSSSKAAIVISIVALLLGGTGLGFGLMAYQKTNTPITFLNDGTDGNSVDFVEGSISDVAEKVSKGVVSIITSTNIYFSSNFKKSSSHSLQIPIPFAPYHPSLLPFKNILVSLIPIVLVPSKALYVEYPVVELT